MLARASIDQTVDMPQTQISRDVIHVLHGDSGQELIFSHGTREIADLVIAAEWLGSAVRGTVTRRIIRSAILAISRSAG
ncbi:hypothetical protein AGRO_5133 [Agrobacterium sp. ATCC 31749]|uniref:hypothetical protein n=1 Tax=unclassified Agrobacterium TaxID=2632611 RepID=UPI00020DBD40|nr:MULTISPECIES: hypothetical protein [unclassified Agrobacterium]EGL62185.1 hypothetical protein AGRO_5133 [Agrobacterium sp. ATCC 31749]QKX00405.1 hypothetical protein GSF67_24945 [Agrobacterium sp. CGMCC 11546]